MRYPIPSRRHCPRRSNRSSLRFLLVAPVLLLAMALLALPAAAQSAPGEGSVTGGFHIGYRAVDVSGDLTKFDEDVHLEDGPRLFDFSLHYVPAAGDEGEGALDGLIDRLDLTADGFGGDPYESLHLNVQRHDRFRLRYTRTTSEYFYEDRLVLPDEVNVRLSNGGDFHHFDFERVRDRASLAVDLTDRAQLTFGLNRYTRRGESTTTLDINRDEFELDRPIDESLNDTHLGFQYAWDRVTLVVEEVQRDFENEMLTFLPGFSEGEAPGPATLDFFFYDQPYELESREHRVRLLARPNDRWVIRAAGALQDYESEIHLSQEAGGLDFRGNPFASDARGAAEVEGDIALFDLEATVYLSDRLAFVGSLFSRNRDQDGALVFGEGGVADVVGDSRWEVDHTGLEAGLQWQATPALQLAFGARLEERDVTHGAAENEPLEVEDRSTSSEGGFVSAAWRPSSGFKLTAEADLGSYDDPFVLTAPTDRLRYRLRGEKALGTAWKLVGSVVGHETDNDDSGFDASYDQANLRLAYTAGEVDFAIGYGLVDIRRKVDQLILGSVVPIDYQAESDFLDARVRWRPAADWDLGATVLLYDNEGSGAGGYDLTRDDVRAYAERWFGDWSLRLAYRNVDFEEDSFAFESYDADVVEAAIGYRW